MAEKESAISHPYKVSEEGSQRILKINYEDSSDLPSIEDSPLCMREVISLLLELKNIDKVSLVQKQEYMYDKDQVTILTEIAKLYDDLATDEEVVSLAKLAQHPTYKKFVPPWTDDLKRIVLYLLKVDPIAAFVEVRRKIFLERVALKQTTPVPADCRAEYLKVLEYVESELAKTRLIKLASPHLEKYQLGSRDIYTKIFRAQIKPYFLYTKVATSYPAGAEEIDSYKIGKDSETEVIIFRQPNEIRPVYYIIPPEFRYSEDKYELLTKAREVITQHKPEQSEFSDPERTREIFYDVEKDLLKDLSKTEGIEVKQKEIDLLTEILLRYTIGFGLIEVLLNDPKVQDISINSPAGVSPVFIVHEDYGECKTNVTVTPRDVDSWATKLRMISGRPLDEANPVLDTDLVLPGCRARVSVIQEPLSPSGIAYAFRRHRTTPWTLPLFIQSKMLTPLAAGLFSFLVDGGRTMMIAGTRSAGKTSFLGALLVEIMRANRIITVEDTLELPVRFLRKMKYDIQSMKVRSAITGGRAEVAAEEGIRASLRLGDSCLIVGEVRSTEAKALYEAMRVGALANVVAGTIHGASPYDVFDRVVNDLGVPITSFKATDIVAVANPVKSASGLERYRRLIQITEVRKFWTKDPLDEQGFVDLFKYNAQKDILEPTDALVEGDSDVLKAIASNIREFAGDWDAVWNNIQLRANIKQAIIDTANKLKRFDLLEAPFVILSNDEFHRISQKVKEEVGHTDPDRIYRDWNLWMKKQIK